MVGYSSVREVLRSVLSDDSIEVLGSIENSEGVAGCQHVRLKSKGEILAAKLGDGVGTKERNGRRLLSEHLPMPAAHGKPLPDVFVYDFIPGQTVNALVRSGHSEARYHLDRFVESNTEMWQRTMSRGSDLEGYPAKLNSTFEMVRNLRLGTATVGNLDEMPLQINGYALPSVNNCLQRIVELIADSNPHCALQHGDEGAANDVVRPDGKHFFIDNGTAGKRLLEEGAAKLIMWFIVTSPVTHYEFDQEGERLVFNYEYRLLPKIREIVGRLVASLRNRFGAILSPERLAACIAVYCFREMQWIMKRGTDTNPGAVLATGFDALRTLSKKEDLYIPGFSR